MQIFKRENSPYTSSSFKLHSLNRERIYEFTDADGGESFKISGADLTNSGLNIEIKSQRTAKIYFYKEE